MKTIAKYFTITILASLTSFYVNAQVKTPCSTDDANKRMETLYPNEVRNAKELLEAETIAFSENRSSSAVIYTIPVVFHILHTYWDT